MPNESLTASSAIQYLPTHLIDQIKAGEVIERPASLIKEILENALDAGAGQIELHLVNNGLDVIQCRDDGAGMSMQDLPLAFSRHATSKIQRFEDLYSLDTFGFRGEALASIASISRVTCTSHGQRGEDGTWQGGRIEIHGGERVAHISSFGRRAGTSLAIKNLFYNTPARLKFVRSQAAEKNAIVRVIHAFLLANSRVQLSLRWDQKDGQLFPAVEREEERVAQVLLKQAHDPQNLVRFAGEYENHFVHGYFSTQGKKGNAGRRHFLFVNGRHFFDRNTHQNILKALEGFWPYGEWGHYVCFIRAPKNLVDVNVHPNKIQVKFFKHYLLENLVCSALQEALASRSVASSAGPGDSRHPSPPPALDRRGLQDFLGQREAEQVAEASAEGETVALALAEEGVLAISPRFYLQRDEDGLVLWDFAAMLEAYCKDIVLQESAGEVTPLLIAEAFSLGGEWDSVLKDLRPRGFDFERTDSATVLLKSLPSSLDAFEPRPVVEYLLGLLRPQAGPEDGPKCEQLYPSAAIRRQITRRLERLDQKLDQYRKVVDDALLARLWEL